MHAYHTVQIHNEFNCFCFQATTKDHDNKAAANQVTQLFGEVERLKSEHENVSTKLENVKKYVAFFFISMLTSNLPIF